MLHRVKTIEITRRPRARDEAIIWQNALMSALPPKADIRAGPSYIRRTSFGRHALRPASISCARRARADKRCLFFIHALQSVPLRLAPATVEGPIICVKAPATSQCSPQSVALHLCRVAWPLLALRYDRALSLQPEPDVRSKRVAALPSGEASHSFSS
jgi:hypothetical protein